ncbi:MAG: bifunctional oligoribonuclease/PAP phosphatase NrnA [Clostridia bacterium]|nr:bifunctional oligoribonuclease/PAP phosphatase NrnA [Clostridia bacterium]
MARTLEPLLEAIRAARTVLVCAHLNPDGDAIGSTLALCHALTAAGKRVTAVNRDPVPLSLSGLPGAEQIRRIDSLGEDERFDLLLLTDVSDARRVTGSEAGFEALRARCGHCAQIDHHGTNPLFCEVNAVDGEAPAVCLPVRELIARLGVPLTPDLAACLYAGLSTDTGNFAYGSTTPEAFRVAAELVEAGLDLAKWHRALFVETSLAAVRLESRALNSLTLSDDGRAAVMRLSRQDFAETGGLPEHCDNLANRALAIRGVRCAALCREEADGSVKLSLRALPPFRVDAIAQRHGGGGHAQAAGATVHVGLEEAAGAVMGELLAQCGVRSEE